MGKRDIQNFRDYRTITTGLAEAIDQATWFAALIAEMGVTSNRETMIPVYGADEIFIVALFLNNADSVTLIPLFYEQEDSEGNETFIGAGLEITIPVIPEHSIEIGGTTYFVSRVRLPINPGAFGMRLKSKTPPTNDSVLIKTGNRQ